MKKWYALYVKMHHEKKLAKRLSEWGHRAFSSDSDRYTPMVRS